VQSPCFFGWGSPPKTIYSPNIFGDNDDTFTPGYTDVTGKKLNNIHDNWEFCADSTEDELVFVIERPRTTHNFECVSAQEPGTPNPSDPQICPCLDGPLITSNTAVGIVPIPDSYIPDDSGESIGEDVPDGSGESETPGNILGDFNGDGIVDGADFGLLLQQWGECPDPPTECPADFNGDGVVDGADLGAFFIQWGNEAPEEVEEVHKPIIARYRHTWTAEQESQLPYGQFKRTGHGLPERASELYQYSFSSARIGSLTGATRTNRLYPLETGGNGEGGKPYFVDGNALGWPSIKYPYDHFYVDGHYGAGNPCYCKDFGPFGCDDTLCGYFNYFAWCQGGNQGNLTHLSPNFGFPCTKAQANIIGVSGDADMWRTSNYGWVPPWDYLYANDSEEEGETTTQQLREYELGGKYFWLQGIAVDTTKKNEDENEDCYYDFGISSSSLDITYIPRNGPFNGNARLHQTLLGVIHREKWYQLYYSSLLVEQNKVNGSAEAPCDTFLKGDDAGDYSDLFSPAIDWFGYPPETPCENGEPGALNKRQDGEDVLKNRVPKYWIQSCAGVPIFSWEIALNDTLLETQLKDVMDSATIATIAAAFESMLSYEGYSSIPGSLNNAGILGEISVARYLMLIFNGFPFWYEPGGGCVNPTGVITPDIARLLISEGILPDPENGGLENGYKIYNKTMKVATNCSSTNTARGLCCFNGGEPITANCSFTYTDNEGNISGYTGPFDTAAADGCPQSPDSTDQDCIDCVNFEVPCGCEIPLCNEAICATDPFCCEVEWDQTCADNAKELSECQIEVAGCAENVLEDECRWYGGQWTPNPFSVDFPEGQVLRCASNNPDNPLDGDGYAVCIANAKGTCSRRCTGSVGSSPPNGCGCPNSEDDQGVDCGTRLPPQDHDDDGFFECRDDCDEPAGERGCNCFETHTGLRDDDDRVGVGDSTDCTPGSVEPPTADNPCPNGFKWLKNTNCINTNGIEVTRPIQETGDGQIPEIACEPRCGPLPDIRTEFPTTSKQQWFYGKPGGWFSADWDGVVYCADNEILIPANDHNNLFPQFHETRNEPDANYSAPWPQYQKCTDESDCGDCPCTICGDDDTCFTDKNCTLPLCAGCAGTDEEGSGPCSHEGTSDTCNGTWLQWSASSANPLCPEDEDPSTPSYACAAVNNGWVLKTSPWLVNSGDGTKIFKGLFDEDLEGWKPSVAFDDPSITPRYDDDGITYDRPRVDWFHPPYHATTAIPSSSQEDPCCWTTATTRRYGEPLPDGTLPGSLCPWKRANPSANSERQAQSCFNPPVDGSLFCSEEACGFYIRDSEGEYDIDPACGKICEPDDNGVLRFCCPYTGQCVPVGTGSSVCTPCAADCLPGDQCCMVVDDEGNLFATCVAEGECEDIGTITP